MHAYKIGRFLGWYYASPVSGARPGHKPKFVIGKDTRRSSYMFEYSIVAGLTASGADAYMLHVTTTPSVSFVTSRDDFDCGIMISASHNPYTDNGIKLVNSQGEKMDDETTARIEAYIDGILPDGIDGDLPLATGEEVGRIVDYAAGRNRYIGYLISLASHSMKGYRVGLDCANGSAWSIAQAVFEALGAKTYVINAEPDGVNINRNAGSTHIEGLKKLVLEKELDVGFAYDGDADRCIAIDDKGNEINGDHILYVFAKALKAQGAMSGKVVTTVMSNLGLYKALDELGVGYEKTKVGDRFVYENMVQNGHIVGGEQSGHIILRKYATTGDGILTSLQLMEAIIESKTSLSKLAAPMVMFPQVLKNVKVADKDAVMSNAAVGALIDEITTELGSDGRVLLRPSGTEPLIRVMAEAATLELCESCVNRLVDVIRSEGLAL